MDNGADSESTGWLKLNCPLLMQCDHSGRVLRMSSRGRAVLGATGQLVDTILSGDRPVVVWRVWQAADSTLMGAFPEGQIRELSSGLLRLESLFVGHFFRLLAAERRLSALARRRRRGSGRKAIRQMELERRRLGRELHTGAGQMLAAIRLQLDLIESQMPAAPPGVREALDRIATLTQDTLEQVRSLSRRLHPPEWQRLALGDAIRQLWQISGIPQRYEAALEIDLPVEPDLEVKILIYRTIQEALSNLARHSRATRVSVSLRSSDGNLTLTVLDNGIGFDVDLLLRQPASLASGIGLRSIREQAEALGAKMSIQSGPSGTTLIVSVPASPAES